MLVVFLCIPSHTDTSSIGDESLGRYSQEKYHPNLEGISYSEGKLYFVSKTMKKLYVLDLDKGTYVSSTTDDYSLYTGEFSNGPDQLVRNGDGDFLYFTEDGKLSISCCFLLS